MLTEDERALMIATICLHGFDLYEHFTPGGLWQPILVAGHTTSYAGYRIVDSIDVTLRRASRRVEASWQRDHWFKLTDSQLEAFHRTVISTC